MIQQILNNRSWEKRISCRKRSCYISGKNIWLKKAYRGRKSIQYLLSKNRCIYDDIWISEEQYDLHLSKNKGE